MRYLLVLLTITSFMIMNTSDINAESGVTTGEKAPDFKLLNIDGKTVSLSDYADRNGVVVVFTCNHCPFSKAYEERLVELNNLMTAKGYPVVAINPNDVNRVPEDSFDNMKIRAEQQGFNFPYLHDESQEIARAYGAARTPHVYVLENKKGEFTVRYIGAIDNNVQNPAEVTEKYVESAVEELHSGQPVTKGITKAVGCTIKWKQ